MTDEKAKHEHVCSTCQKHEICEAGCLVDDSNCPVDDDFGYECEECCKETLDVWQQEESA
jgi:hypothetical protein